MFYNMNINWVFIHGIKLFDFVAVSLKIYYTLLFEKYSIYFVLCLTIYLIVNQNFI